MKQARRLDSHWFLEGTIFTAKSQLPRLFFPSKTTSWQSVVVR